MILCFREKAAGHGPTPGQSAPLLCGGSWRAGGRATGRKKSTVKAWVNTGKVCRSSGHGLDCRLRPAAAHWASRQEDLLSEFRQEEKVKA